MALRSFFRPFQVGLLTLALGVASVASAAPFDRDDLQRIEKRVQTVSEKAMPSVIAITHRLQGNAMASGTGTIVSEDGLILTAAHVIRGAESVDIYFIDGTTRTAKVLGSNDGRDVALIRINEKGKYPFVPLGKSADLKVGDPVVALGHPGGFDRRRQPPVRYGRIFATNLMGYLRTDCTLVGGDSGGPLLDLDGKLVGVHSSIGFDASVNNDVPVDVATTDWQRLLAGERWGEPMLGRDGPQRGGGRPRLTPEELAGLDQQKFRLRMGEFSRNNRTQPAPAELKKWLKEDGMDAAKVDALNDTDLQSFVRRAAGRGRGMGGGFGGNNFRQPTTRPNTDIPKTLNVPKLKELVDARAKENNGRLNATPDTLAKWFKDAGVPSDDVDAMSPMDMVALFSKVMEGEIDTAPLIPRRLSNAGLQPVIDQDKAIFSTIRETLAKVSPSVVELRDGRTILAHGTIVRADGFILTKQSEIAKVKTALTARLNDGRSFPAKTVAQFAEHDLALVKIDAKNLAPIDLKTPEAVRPGSFVFSPGTSTDNLLIATGAISVPARSLRSEGGYLGVNLVDGNGGVLINSVSPDGPALKAGLKSGDVITAFDGKPVTRRLALSDLIRGALPGTKVKLTVRRDGNTQDYELTLGDRGQAIRLAGPQGIQPGAVLSDVRSGFPMVLQHDQPIAPSDCGGPLVSLNGSVVGLNIARAGRIDAYAIPSATVLGILNKVNFNDLAKRSQG